MVSKTDWIKSFNKPTPREGQESAINQAIEFFDSKPNQRQVVILDAPTGIGKSDIGACIARYYATKHGYKANYLTFSKFLEQQILRDFPFIKKTLGRSNFPCENAMVDGRFGITCDNGKCQMESDEANFRCDFGITFPQRKQNSLLNGSDDAPDDGGVAFISPTRGEAHWRSGEHCQYIQMKADAINTDIVIHNYAYFLLEANYIGDFSGRQVLVCDEGHKIEDALMGLVTFILSKKAIQHFFTDFYLRSGVERGMFIDGKLPNLDINGWIDMLTKMEDYLENYSVKIKEMMNSDVEKKDVDRFHDTIIRVLTVLDDTWVIDYELDSSNEPEKIVFKPVTVDKFAFDRLFKHGLKIIIMSATLFSKEMMIKTLGLGEMDRDGDVKYIALDSTFPIKNRLVTYKPSTHFNKSNFDESVADILPIIDEILDDHDDQKGIIHTKSYKLSKAIVDGLKLERVISHDKFNRQDVIKRYMTSSEPLVLVSPSIEEGIDLKDDLCRFIIITKVPYLNLGDKQIARRAKLDSSWYAWKCIQTIVQMAGRGVRHDNDYCDTYILDNNFERLLRQYKRFFPKWFLDALVIDGTTGVNQGYVPPKPKIKN